MNDSGLYYITNRCTACEYCVPVCPVDCIFIGTGKLVIDTDQCTGCRACVLVCPEDAITLFDPGVMKPEIGIAPAPKEKKAKS